MRVRRLSVVALVVAVTVAGGAWVSHAAIVFPFEGHEASAGVAAPSPLQWQVVADRPLGAGVTADFWVIGDTTWPSSTSGDWFFISFTGRTISSDVGENGTEFVHSEGGIDITWDRHISPDGLAVDFIAPAGITLDQGESFRVQIRWVTDASDVDDFTAHWTRASVPEPPSLIVLGAGLAALCSAYRRRAPGVTVQEVRPR
jgi:hypothetical protein